ncbi:MAG: tryptophan synthase subunit alpha [Clostridia bacterium]|nr:tryptophan synthase subunit alpha [Clostridia bacterium]
MDRESREVPAAAGRLENRTERNAERGAKAFAAYFMAGDPDLETTLLCMRAAASAGASLIELGVPYSDPSADGPVIRRAGIRALAAGTRMDDVFRLAARFRAEDDVAPVALMLYFNLVFRYGTERFFRMCLEHGIDACILPDLPIEEQDEVRLPARKSGIRLIQLVSPNSGAAVPAICARAEGFLYCVSSLGTTGERTGVPEGLDGFLDRLAAETGVPRFVGFGVSTPEQAAAMARHADGVIVGSALVRLIEQSVSAGMDAGAIARSVGRFTESMCAALGGGRIGESRP